MKKYHVISLVCFLFLCVYTASDLQAQLRNTDHPQFEIEGNITSHTGMIPPPYLAIVDMNFNHKILKTNSSKYSVKLSYENEYVLIVKKAGFIPQIIRISFKNATTSIKGVSSFLYDIQLKVAKEGNLWRDGIKFTHINWDPKDQIYSKSRWVLSKMQRKNILDMIEINNEQINMGILYFLIGDVLHYEKPDNFDYVGYGNISKNMPERKKELMSEQITKQQGYLEKDLALKNEREIALQADIEKFDLDYSVQVWSSETPLSMASPVRTIVPDLMEVKSDDGLYRYYSGNFKDFNDANNFYDSIYHRGARDAFVVAFHKGDKITLPNYISEDEIIIRSSGHKMSEYNKEIAFLEVQKRKYNLEKKIKQNKLALVQLRNDPLSFNADSITNKKGIDSLDYLLLNNSNELTHKTELAETENKRIQEVLKREKELEKAKNAFRTDPIKKRSRSRRATEIEYVYINNPEFHDSIADSAHFKVSAGINAISLLGDIESKKGYGFHIDLQQYISPIFHIKAVLGMGDYKGNSNYIAEDSTSMPDWSGVYSTQHIVKGSFKEFSIGPEIHLSEVYKKINGDKTFRFNVGLYIGAGLNVFEGRYTEYKESDNIRFIETNTIEKTSVFFFPASLSISMPLSKTFELAYQLKFNFVTSNELDGFNFNSNKQDHLFMNGLTLQYKMYPNKKMMQDYEGE